MAKSEPILFDQYLVLGIPIIDKQHANLVRMVNNLYLACQKSRETTNQQFIEAVHESVDYVRYHFSTEEKLMLLLSYPEFSVHKKKHGDFIWEILTISKQFEDGEKFVPKKFVFFLCDWIKNHIGDTDKLFAEYFMTMKKDGKLNTILAWEPKVR